jgi:hypothetical protein
VTLKSANHMASHFLIDFALGLRTPSDLQAQELFLFLETELSARVARLLHHYRIANKIKKLEAAAINSQAEVLAADDGFILMVEREKKASFKMKPIDVYVSYFLNLDESYQYYPLLKFYFSFSPYLELFVFSEGLERLQN